MVTFYFFCQYNDVKMRVVVVANKTLREFRAKYSDPESHLKT